MLERTGRADRWWTHSKTVTTSQHVHRMKHFLGAGTMRNICTHKPSPPPPIVKRNSSQPDQAGKHCLFTIHLVAHLYFLAFQQPKQPLCSPHSCFSDPNMALREAWLSAPEGRLCPWQQARALALREASAEIHGAPWLPWIAESLRTMLGVAKV